MISTVKVFNKPLTPVNLKRAISKYFLNERRLNHKGKYSIKYFNSTGNPMVFDISQHLDTSDLVSTKAIISRVTDRINGKLANRENVKLYFIFLPK